MYGYIYLITNRVNRKIYVGQHKYDKMELDPNYHGGGTMLHKAYKKYGIDKFDTILIDSADTLEELNQKEIFYIDALDCRNPNVGYNIAEGGGKVGLGGADNGMFGKHHTKEAKQKISKANSGVNHGNYGKPSFMKGKHHTEETKQKIGASNKGKPKSEEHKTKISLALQNKGVAVWINDIMFNSVKNAYEYIINNKLSNMSISTLYNLVRKSEDKKLYIKSYLLQ